MQDFVESSTILYREMIDCVKEIEDKSSEVAHLMYSLHKLMN